MSDNSKIEWTDATWNFLIGCTKKSTGCENCYAIKEAHRMAHNPNEKVHTKALNTVRYDSTGKLNWTGVVNFSSSTVKKPLYWKKPKRIFVNSLSDLFHKNVKEEWLDQAFAVMALCPQHQFQILTKEPERMRDYMHDVYAGRMYEIAESFMMENSQCLDVGQKILASFANELSNVWLGTSCENQETADRRIPPLMETPASVRWISAEPLIGHIDFESVPTIEGSIDWVVAGGESGPKARPTNPEWFRSIRDQCIAAKVPFLFKQHGAWIGNDDIDNADLMAPQISDPDEYFESHRYNNRTTVYRIGKKAAGRILDGRSWDEYPSVNQ